MTNKELIMAALRCEETPRPAWVPFVGVHGAYILGKTATEYLQSADLIVEGVLKAYELYKGDGMPVSFDLQMEAEVLGCELHWVDDCPPSVATHPLEEYEDDWSVDNLPEKLDMSAGRIPVTMDATKRIVEKIGSDAAIYGLLCGPFTLALHLLGNDIFMEMYDEEEKVEALIDRCADYAIQMSEAYIEAGCDIVAVVDPMVSQISPDHFEQFVTPSMNKIYDYIRSKGAMSSCFVCGDVTRNLECMGKLTCDNMSVDEQIDMSVCKEVALRNNKSFGGNLKLTVTLLMGDEDACKLDALECYDKCVGKGFIMAPGCDLPYDTKVENLQAAASIALDEYSREAARSITAAKDDSFDDIIIPDYAGSKKVIINAVTLDSASCAACTYMWNAAKRAAEALGDDIVVASEHKIRDRDGVGMMVKLGVKNLPTICIDGVPTFESLVPTDEELQQAIKTAYNNKK